MDLKDMFAIERNALDMATRLILFNVSQVPLSCTGPCGRYTVAFFYVMKERQQDMQ